MSDTGHVHPSPDPWKHIKPTDLHVECHSCGGHKNRIGLKGELAHWNGTGCTDCMGCGWQFPKQLPGVKP